MISLSRPRVTAAAAITGAVLISLVGCSSTHSPGSSPAGTSTPNSTPTTSTSAPTGNIPVDVTPSAGAICTTSMRTGQCGPYSSPKIAGTSGEITVGNDVWSPPSGSWSQTLYVTSPDRWSVVANFPAGLTSVHSYPNTGQTQNWITGTQLPAPLSSWSSMLSSYSVNLSTNKGNVGEAAYDLWLNDWHNEVMIQTDFVGDSLRPRCDVLGDVTARQTFGGTDGVPVQRWNLCQFGSETIWQPATGTNYPSGKVNVMAMLNWLENNGNRKYLPKNSTLTAISFGIEICSTGGRNSSFQVNDFSFTATPASA
jgi:hypothetical protein